jgi:hypothetical protein
MGPERLHRSSPTGGTNLLMLSTRTSTLTTISAPPPPSPPPSPHATATLARRSVKAARHQAASCGHRRGSSSGAMNSVGSSRRSRVPTRRAARQPASRTRRPDRRSGKGAAAPSPQRVKALKRWWRCSSAAGPERREEVVGAASRSVSRHTLRAASMNWTW